MRGPRIVSLILSILLLPSLSAAQGNADGPTQFNISHTRYDATGTGLSVLAGASTLDLLQGTGGFTFHFTDEPFVLYEESDGDLSRLGGIIQSQFMMDLHGGIGFRFVDVGFVLPVAPVIVWGSDPTGGDFPVGDNDQGAVGDLVVIPKVRILDPARKKFGLAVQIPVSLPTGQKARYLGDDGVSLAVDLVAELRLSPVRVLVKKLVVIVDVSFVGAG